MKKFFKSNLFEKIVLTTASMLHLLFMIIVFSLGVTEKYDGGSIWQTASLYKNRPMVCYFSIGFIVLFVVEMISVVLSVLLLFIKKKRSGFYFSIPLGLGLGFFILFVHIVYRMLGAGALVTLIMSIVLTTASFAFLIHRHITDKTEVEEFTLEENPQRIKLLKRILLILEAVGTGVLFILFFIPIYTNTNKADVTRTYYLINALTKTDYPVYVYIYFILFMIIFFVSVIYFISSLSYYKAHKLFVQKSKNYIYCHIAVSFVFFLVGYMTTFIMNLQGGNASTISFIPFLISLVLFIFYSIIVGKIGLATDKNEKEASQKQFRIEPLIFVFLLTCITFMSLFFNMIEIKMGVGISTTTVKLTGLDLLKTYQDLSGGFQGLAFALFAVLLISGILLVLSLVSFFAKYKEYYKVIKASAFTNVFFMMLLGLFGFYYKIAQKINEEHILSLLEKYHLTLPTDYVYTVKSQMIYLLGASLAVLIFMIVRGQLNHKIDDPLELVNLGADENSKSKVDSRVAESAPQFEFDACPAFTELDSRLEEFKQSLEERRKNLFENLTLPNLVRFIVDYARESRLHLSYSLEDIATFVAGLGASRLTILQGMSGTGKTSLPKIFAEAIMGTCEVVEVESSWRDKNELLGYYNEFSKCFTPKKFTQCLYKARLNAEVPTFIVLDEMNLSRIEYYFSDFLSLMEHEEDKRQIKLLNVKLVRKSQEESYEYYGLTNGHTILIPTNVWFIGTANRDESTFEISDKVYDRAQTMNFNKRAPKIHSFSEPIPQRYVPYEAIAKLFEEAKENYTFEAEDDAIVQKVEKLLIPFNISFGNRILKQMEEFVKIYCACFGDKNAVVQEAVEKILLSKVVSKLEYKIVENKEVLAVEFDKLGLSACSAFVRKLNED